MGVTSRARSVVARSLAAALIASTIVALAPSSSAEESPLSETAVARLIGPPDSRVGETIDAAGDVNGDGRADIVTGGRDRAFVVFGGKSGDISLTAPSTDFFEISMSEPTRSTVAVAAAGDVDGDGLDDILVGFSRATPSGRKKAGSAFLVFGRANTAPVVVDTPNALGVIRIDGATPWDRAGVSVESAGDVDGDGVPEVAIGAPRADDSPNGKTGGVYVLSGAALAAGADLGDAELGDVDLAAGYDGYLIHSPPIAKDVGWSIGQAGDMNDDGTPDLVIGAPSSFILGPPAIFVVFGDRALADVSLSELDGRGFMIRGGNGEAEEGAGTSVSGSHDLNGDGIPDVAIGAPSAMGPFGLIGATFVVFGKTDSLTVRLDRLGDDGFRIDGGQHSSGVGSDVELTTDHDGNGVADLLVGVPWERTGQRPNYGAVVHLVGPTSDVWLQRLGKAGISHFGHGDEHAGESVAAVGDFDGDGSDDFATGAPGANVDGGHDGLVYVFGPVEPPTSDPPPAATLISWGTYQVPAPGSYCWDTGCVDRRPTFPKAKPAGSGDEAHLYLDYRVKPDAFSISAYKKLDEFDRPAGKATELRSKVKPRRLYRGAPRAGYEVLFHLPKWKGPAYIAATGLWGPNDVNWFLSLKLKPIDHSDMAGPPDVVLVSGDKRRKGAQGSYCWSRSFSDGTGYGQCADVGGYTPEPVRLKAGDRARLRFLSSNRPDRLRGRVYRADRDGSQTGEGSRVRFRWRKHDGAWDALFRLPGRSGHFALTVEASWPQGHVPYDWHLLLAD